jgi:hypothetical protein
MYFRITESAFDEAWKVAGTAFLRSLREAEARAAEWEIKRPKLPCGTLGDRAKPKAKKSKRGAAA